MIAVVFDQLHKLMGRAFLISAFLPTLVTVGFALAVLEGVDAFGEFVDEWTADSGRAIVQAAVALIGAYLVAYLLYGLRGALSRVFQGNVPAGPISQMLRRRQSISLERKRRRLDDSEAEVDVAFWPTAFGFAPSGRKTQLDPEVAERWLTQAAGDVEALRSALASGDSPDGTVSELLRSVLQKAMVLQARAAKSGKDARVTQLVESVKETWDAHPELQPALGKIHERALGEWTEALADLTASFPTSERWLKPTRFGNVLAALDSSIIRRYHIRLRNLWPRLLHVASDDVKARVDDAAVYVDFMLMMSFLSAIAAGVAAAAIGGGPPRPLIQDLLLVFAPTLTCFLFYRLAVAGVRALGEHIEAAVDLFRLRLLDALSIRRPADVAAEQETWRQIETFLLLGEVPSGIELVVPKDPQPDDGG